MLSPYEFTSALDSFVWVSESILGGCEEAKTGEDEVLVNLYPLFIIPAGRLQAVFLGNIDEQPRQRGDQGQQTVQNGKGKHL